MWAKKFQYSLGLFFDGVNSPPNLKLNTFSEFEKQGKSVLKFEMSAIACHSFTPTRKILHLKFLWNVPYAHHH